MLLLTITALALRFCRLANQSLWTDEVASILTAQAPLNRISEESALNNSLPTYFLLLRGVLGGATQNVEFRARAISAISGALCVPVFIGLVYLWRRHWGTALLAGLLLAVNPLHIWYCQEVRAYALMLLFGLLTVLCYELARRRGRGWWAGYVLCSLIAIALHKTALVFPVACALWDAWEFIRPHSVHSTHLRSPTTSPRSKRASLRFLCIHAAVLAIAISLLMPKASPPPQEFTRSSSVLELGYTVMTYLGGYSFGPSPSDIQTHGALRALSSHPFQVGMLCALLLLIVIACGSEFSSHRKLWASASPSALPGKELSLLMLSIGIVAGVALVSGFPYNIRYTLPGLFGFLGLLAAFSTALKRTWLQRGLIASLLTISLWADAQWFFDPAYRKGDSRAVAHWLTQNQDRVQTWTTLPDYLSLSLNWYLKPYPAVAERLQPPAKANTTSFPPTPDVLIIGRRHHILQPEELIAAYKAAAGKTRVITTFTGFELYVRDAAR